MDFSRFFSSIPTSIHITWEIQLGNPYDMDQSRNLAKRSTETYVNPPGSSWVSHVTWIQLGFLAGYF